MGRLFWKFFIMFWLAQVLTMVGVGISVWALRPSIAGGIPVGSSPQGMLPPLLPIVAGIVVSLVFAALLAWYFARPIRSLRKAFNEVANGHFDTRIGETLKGRQDELANLGHDFDHMAFRLQSLMDSQRRLLHDVSHELRSPLARLQAIADLMQQQPERATELIPRIERDTSRIDTLVGELLTLARLDSGIAQHIAAPFDLRELIEHIVADASLEAEIKQCTVLVTLPDNIPLKGDQELLFRALENLVRNAIAHSPAGKKIMVLVTRDQERWQISVEDEGPGVPPSELENIFQPFVRGKGNSSAGFGLGLAITQRIVLAHGGELSATNRSTGGLRVEISLPFISPTTK